MSSIGTLHYVKASSSVNSLEFFLAQFGHDISEEVKTNLRQMTRTLLTSVTIYMNTVAEEEEYGPKEKLFRALDIGISLLAVAKRHMRVLLRDEWAQMHVACALDLTTNMWRKIPSAVASATIKEARNNLSTDDAAFLDCLYASEIHKPEDYPPGGVGAAYRAAFDDYLEMDKVFPKLADIIPLNLRRSKK